MYLVSILFISMMNGQANIKFTYSSRVLTCLSSLVNYLGFYNNTISFKLYKTVRVLATRMHITEPIMMSDKQMSFSSIFLINFFQ